jgi:hypothetical protein
MQQQHQKNGAMPSQRISAYIAELGGWRGEMLARLRDLIHQAAPGISEEWKWDTPVFSQNGAVCAAGAFKEHVKLNFFKGASLPDPKGLFNAGLDAKASRAIDLREGDQLDAAGLKDLVRAAVELNARSGKKK